MACQAAVFAAMGAIFAAIFGRSLRLSERCG
jgi:hypothetical protein